MKTKFLLAALLAAAGTLPAAAVAAGFDGWDTAGDAVVAGPTLTLTTAYLDGAGDEPYNLSGTPAADIATLEAFAGVAAYAFDLGAEPATEGSLARRSFGVAAGDTLRFEWRFDTVEDLFLDHAFAVVGGEVTTLATRGTPAGWHDFAYTFADAGSFEIALGVVDTVDVNGVSTLAVRAFEVSPVPEPAPWALLAAGLLAGLPLLRGRRPGA
jgi:hypothetical protein